VNAARGAARLALGGVLISAGLFKIGDPWAFAEAIAHYRLLPAQGNQVLAAILPWWEISAGLLILAGLWTRPAGLLAGALFAAFGAAVAAALLRGLDIECGCFGTGAAGRVGLKPLLIDILGLGLVLLLLSRREEREPQPAR
jgi:putative oxidoreductase